MDALRKEQVSGRNVNKFLVRAHHPQAVGETGEGEGGDKDGNEGGDQERLRFGGKEREEEVQQEPEEVHGARVHWDGPVAVGGNESAQEREAETAATSKRQERDSHDEGVAERADKEERDRDERRREVVVTRGVQAVGAFADKDGAFLRAAIRVSLEKKRGLERESQPRGKRECRQRSSKGGQQVSTASGTNRKERTTHESEEGDRKERDGEAVIVFVCRVAEVHPYRSEHEAHADQ